MTLIMFMVIGLLAIQTLYLVECSRRDQGRRTKYPPFCKLLCKDNSQCGETCPNCKGGIWTPYECAA
uniref:Putative secreted protein n=1 Tax=Ixodes ricinus TaxID=34613 RepID=V5HIZ2_IXORI